MWVDADGCGEALVLLDQRECARIALESGAGTDADDVRDSGRARALKKGNDVGEMLGVQVGVAVDEPHPVGCTKSLPSAAILSVMVPWIAVGMVAIGQPVIAVFEIEDSSARKKAELDVIRQLSEYLSGQIAEGGRFRVVASADLARLLQQQKKESYKNCFDEACQIEIGKALAAEKSLSTRLMHLGKSCILKSTLFDLAKEVSEQVATVKGGCSADELTEAVEKIALKLKGEASGPQTEETGETGDLELTDQTLIDPTLNEATLPPANCAAADACYRLGLDHRDGKNGRQRDVPLARAHLFAGCRKGSGAACTDLGYLFEKGKLIAKDARMAAQLYFRGCELGYAKGCTNTGYMYEKGKGVRQDPVRAVSYYEKGCNMGNARGCTNLGYMVRNGVGVTQDDARARELYRRACEGGNAGGCTNLGYLHQTGQGARQDLALAVRLYRRGCDGGSGIGCGNLGSMYEYGQGVGRSAAQAMKYYRKGCEAGNRQSCDGMRKLERGG